MEFYEVVKFLHILAAMVWFGGGFLLVMLAERGFRSNDREEVGRIMDQAGVLAKMLFIPASLVVLALGIVMTIDAWSFDQLWIVLALAGFATSFVLGAGVLGPRAEKVSEKLATEGMTDANYAESKRVLIIARFDYVMLVLIAFDMVVKPTSDNVGVLAVMALVLAVGVFAILSQYRAVSEPAGPGPTAAPAT